MTDRRDEIAREIDARLVCGYLPYGAKGEIARLVHVSHEYVRLVAVEMGVRTQPSQRRQPRSCKHCGEPVPTVRRMCDACRFIPLVCDTCGKLFQREREQVMAAARQERYKGGVFCSKKCYRRIR